MILSFHLHLTYCCKEENVGCPIHSIDFRFLRSRTCVLPIHDQFCNREFTIIPQVLMFVYPRTFGSQEFRLASSNIVKTAVIGGQWCQPKND